MAQVLRLISRWCSEMSALLPEVKPIVCFVGDGMWVFDSSADCPRGVAAGFLDVPLDIRLPCRGARPARHSVSLTFTAVIAFLCLAGSASVLLGRPNGSTRWRCVTLPSWQQNATVVAGEAAAILRFWPS